jgi:hypothetical protein
MGFGFRENIITVEHWFSVLFFSKIKIVDRDALKVEISLQKLIFLNV